LLLLVLALIGVGRASLSTQANLATLADPVRDTERAFSKTMADRDHARLHHSSPTKRCS
jgi:hypothetical protein